MSIYSGNRATGQPSDSPSPDSIGYAKRPRRAPIPKENDAQSAVLDPAIIAELRELSSLSEEPNLLARMVERFLRDLSPRIDSLRAALGQDNAPTLATLAHDLRGACLNLGATHMGMLCGRLETATRDRAFVEIGELIIDLEREAALVRNALEAERAPIR